MEGVYGLGDASSIMFGLRRGQGMNAGMVKAAAAADDCQKTQWTTEVLALLVMGNPNIQRLWGMCLFEDSFGVLLENVSVQLGEFVSNRGRLPEWARQLHSALLFLEQADFVHRHLRLKACFLSFTFQLKLAVFCLGDGVTSQRIQTEDADGCRWAPWESLAGSYDLKSVVWTYGTVLWSMCHSGAVPYKNQTTDQIRDPEFRKDYELASDPHAFPANVEEVVAQCWQEEDSRPSISRIKSFSLENDAMENEASTRTVTILGRVFPRDAFVCRLFYLAYFASFGSLFPLLAVYFKQLGMTAAQAGILLGARPLVELASGPFWGSFASRFRKQKILLLFSLVSLIIFTLAIGFVQPVTPYCVVLVPGGNKTCEFALAPAGKIVRGGALGLLKEAVVGRTRRQAENQIIEKIIDLSSFDNEEDTVAGIAPEYITRDRICNYDEEEYGILVSPPHSTRVYRQPAVEQAFMLLLILIVLGEFASAPALPLADAATLQTVKEGPQEFGQIRLFASAGWGLAMLILGIGLDYSDTFRNHPCPTDNTTEKNYTLCFVMCSVFMCAAVLLATQFKFSDDTARPDEVHGLVMDTREGEVSHVVAEKARARQVTVSNMATENRLLIAIKALADRHVLVYLASVTVMGFGAGIIFSFLFWHLQDLGGSPVLFGILSVVNHASEIIAFFFTFQIINKYGHVKVMYICLAANVCRFLVLSWLTNPWLVLPLQVAQGFTLCLVWTSASSYISLIAPPHIKSNAQYLLHFLYHGVGKGVGSILGGLVISNIGTRLTFLSYAVLCAAMWGGGYALNKFFKYEGIKYSSNMFEEDEMDMMAPQGVPIARDGKITDAFNTTSAMNSNYGAISQPQADPTQDAYDKYVSSYQ